MNEHDVAALTRDFPQYGLIQSQKGTIVYVYNENNFEVEFCDESGYTLHLGMFKKEYLELVRSAEI